MVILDTVSEQLPHFYDQVFTRNLVRWYLLVGETNNLSPHQDNASTRYDRVGETYLETIQVTDFIFVLVVAIVTCVQRGLFGNKDS